MRLRLNLEAGMEQPGQIRHLSEYKVQQKITIEIEKIVGVVATQLKKYCGLGRTKINLNHTPHVPEEIQLLLICLKIKKKRLLKKPKKN